MKPMITMKMVLITMELRGECLEIEKVPHTANTAPMKNQRKMIWSGRISIRKIVTCWNELQLQATRLQISIQSHFCNLCLADWDALRPQRFWSFMIFVWQFHIYLLWLGAVNLNQFVLHFIMIKIFNTSRNSSFIMHYNEQDELEFTVTNHVQIKFMENLKKIISR